MSILYLREIKALGVGRDPLHLRHHKERCPCHYWPTAPLSRLGKEVPSKLQISCTAGITNVVYRGMT